MLKILRIGFLLLCFIPRLQAQPLLTGGDWIGRIGGTLQLGSPVNRAGLVLSFGYQSDQGEALLEWRGYYNFSTFGPSQKGLEQHLQAAVHVGFGPPLSSGERLFAPQYAYLPRHYAFGYVAHWYLDQQQTAQWSGSFALKTGRLRIALENDAFAFGKPHDRFRTGAWSIAYQQGFNTWELQNLLWHGEKRCPGACNVRDTDYPCRFGYRRFDACLYGQYSHGILKARWHRRFPYHQSTQVGLGLDAEQIRNFFQNRLVPHLWFFPKSWNKARNPHYLMLDAEGMPYLALPGQLIRPVRWVWELGWNGEGGY
ncbi:MAG: hypothetical protein KDC44_15395, partial [Phaeodactylibacter sp.]|nr:hypothetical protein [Phaeodactylibacter sp.]